MGDPPPSPPGSVPGGHGQHGFASVLRHTAAGALGGSVAAAILNPLEVLRVRLQSVESASKRPRPLALAEEIWRAEGPLAFFRGFVTSIIGVGPSRALYFGGLRFMKERLGPRPPEAPGSGGGGGGGGGGLLSGIPLDIVSSSAAGVFASTVMSPWWVIRIRLQMQHSPVALPVWMQQQQLLLQRPREGGVERGAAAASAGATGTARGLNGSGGTVRIGAESAAAETTAAAPRPPPPPLGEPGGQGNARTLAPPLAAPPPGLEHRGAAAGSAAAASTLPRAAAQHGPSGVAVGANFRTAGGSAAATANAPSPPPPVPGGGYRGIVDCARRIFREEGWRAFYRGLAASYLGVVETALSFTLYSYMKQTLLNQKKRSGETERLQQMLVVREAITAQQRQRQRPGAQAAAEDRLSPSRGTAAAELDDLAHLSAAAAAAASASGSHPPSAAHVVPPPSLDTTFFIGAASKLIASALTYPHEVLRTRVREQRSPAPGEVLKYRGILQTARTIVAEEGVRGLYGGMSVHLVRTVPNAAIIVLVVEYIVGGDL